MNPPARTAAALLAALLACDGDGATPAPRGAPLYTCDACEGSSARLPDGRGGTACVPVGASLDPTPDDPRPLVGELPAPVRYVAAGAPDTGDGTRDRPFPTLARALASGPSGTIVLGAGRHSLDAPVAASGALVVVGAGVAQTTIVARTAAFSAGAGASLSVARLSFEGASIAVSAASGGRVALRDVAAHRGATALSLSGRGTTAVARGLTVDDATSHAVTIDDGAALALSDALIRRGGGYGVRARAGARARLTRLLVDGARGYGVAFAGAADGAGEACGGDAMALPGGRDCVRDLSVRAVEGVGLGVVGARDVGVWRAHVCGTRAGIEATGDGVYLAAGARVAFDEDAPNDPATAPGRATWVVANARAGVLVERTRPDALDAPETTVTLRGTVVSSNEGPGVVLQRGATARSIDHARLADNAGLALGLTPGTRVDAILCDQFTGTRPAVLPTTEGPYGVADGLSMRGASAARVDDNDFSGNGRFGVVFDDADALLTRNRGRDNLYGVGDYARGRVRIDDASAIAGRATPPTTRPPVVVSAM